MKTYHENDAVAMLQDAFKAPGSPAGSVGPADDLGGLPEPPSGGDFDVEPPLTNRGALLTPPLINQFLVDWVSVTFKVLDPHEVLQIIRLNSSLFSELEYGFSGYTKSLRFGQISIFYAGRDDMGCHVRMSGQGCRQYEGQFEDNPWLDLFTHALKHKGTFTRLDIAHDNVDGCLDLDKLRTAIFNREVRSRFKGATDTQNVSFSENIDSSEDGHTIYFGKRSSRVMIRFYDKAAQMKINMPFPWNRAEVELKEKRAQRAVQILIAGTSVGSLFVGVINQYLAIINLDDCNKSRCSLQSWWSKWLQSAEKVRLTTDKQVKTVEELMEYVKRQYAPSIAMFKLHLGIVTFNEFIRELVVDGTQRMGMKHEQMLFVSAHGKADNYDLSKDAYEERAAIIEYDGGLERKAAEELARQEHEEYEP